jgi:hypothetical protein
MKRFAILAVAALAACSGGGGTAGGPPPLNPTPAPTPAGPAPSPPSLANVQRISADPFTNGGSQHQTEVEPSAASNGLTIVAAFQAGRFFTHGASDIAFATSFDGGASWQSGTLPATTHYTLPPGPYDSISDPSIAYDARHATWLITGLPIFFDGSAVPGVVVSTSLDGLTWSAPIGVTAANQTTNDKNWIACDNHPGSPFYGRCYVEWDSFAGNGTIFMSTSSDGGHTWTAPASPPSTIGGIGGQPVVQPDGTVIVPIDDIYGQNVLAFRSRDGGTTWSSPVGVSNIADHASAGNIRSLPLVSAVADAAGTVYVVWHDCRFRTNCSANDLVITTSRDGINWTPVQRIPADALASSVDHFIPGLGIQPGTSGGGAHLGVTYYSYADTACTSTTCRLSANFIASQDGGATWGAPTMLAGPMNLSWLAQTLDGPMVGDYMATTFSSGRAVSFTAIANPLRSGAFDEGTYVPKPGIISLQSVVRRSSIGERPVPGFHSDHPPRRLHP